eukprot:PITA_17404
MQKKDQTFTKFYEFKALVKKESGKKIKALKSDNSGEYVSQDFKYFCAVEGIKRELTKPHNPQQNGVAERNNRTIVGATREMLQDQGLPLHFWAEACNTMVFLQNRSLHRILGMKTPEEAFSGKRPDVGHFRSFGSSVVEELLVPKEEEPQTNTYKLHVEVPGVETSTQAHSFRDGRKCTREVDRLLEDAKENVGAPSSQRRQRRSPERYTGYMALTGECVEPEPSSFEEAVQQPIWVDVMVEEYDSIVRNNVWDVVPRPENKSVVSSHWLYKVKQAVDGSVENHKARFVARGFS